MVQLDKPLYRTFRDIAWEGAQMIWPFQLVPRVVLGCKITRKCGIKCIQPTGYSQRISWFLEAFGFKPLDDLGNRDWMTCFRVQFHLLSGHACSYRLCRLSPSYSEHGLIRKLCPLQSHHDTTIFLGSSHHVWWFIGIPILMDPNSHRNFPCFLHVSHLLKSTVARAPAARGLKCNNCTRVRPGAEEIVGRYDHGTIWFWAIFFTTSLRPQSWLIRGIIPKWPQVSG
jgi:hypothetical protein